MSETDIYRKIWAYFRKGKTELWFIVGLYNTIQLWYLRGVFEVRDMLIIIVATLLISIVFGYIIIKKLETTNPYVNPFTQDGIKASIYFYNAMLLHILEDDDLAIEMMKTALKLREKWVEE